MWSGMDCRIGGGRRGVVRSVGVGEPGPGPEGVGAGSRIGSGQAGKGLSELGSTGGERVVG